MHAHAVIGANYGDEGKGLMTDYLVRQHAADVVVRFNGGAQAGHTVVTPSGVRHVFSHFSSGSFAEAATYLSRFFVCNPALFNQEATRLDLLLPKVMVDPFALVTTPWDMLINQEVENQRTNRHGSCGVGFNETIERSRRMPLCYADISGTSRAGLRAMLKAIATDHVLPRCFDLKLTKEARDRCMDGGMMDRFLDDCDFMASWCTPALPQSVVAKSIVFEGAQGLMLDQNNEADFPHLTRSNTGCQNIADMAHQFGVDELSLVYVTRTYLTRHGAGPLPNEWAPEEVPEGIKDETNIPHPFQGTLRFAKLDSLAMSRRIEADAARTDGRVKVKTVQVASTCHDQLECSRRVKFASYGPTASSVEVRNPI